MGIPLVYVDTSALGALLVAQAETAALVDWLDRANVMLVSSDLLETELRRMAVREGSRTRRDRSRRGALAAILDGDLTNSGGFLTFAVNRS